jgi:hypothetical protein
LQSIILYIIIGDNIRGKIPLCPPFSKGEKGRKRAPLNKEREDNRSLLSFKGEDVISQEGMGDSKVKGDEYVQKYAAGDVEQKYRIEREVAACCCRKF